MKKKVEKYNVTVLLSLHTDNDDKPYIMKQLASIPNVELHVDYDKSDRDNRFKLAAVSKILNDIDAGKPTKNPELYTTITNLKQILSDADNNTEIDKKE